MNDNNDNNNNNLQQPPPWTLSLSPSRPFEPEEYKDRNLPDITMTVGVSEYLNQQPHASTLAITLTMVRMSEPRSTVSFAHARSSVPLIRTALDSSGQVLLKKIRPLVLSAGTTKFALRFSLHPRDAPDSLPLAEVLSPAFLVYSKKAHQRPSRKTRVASICPIPPLDSNEILSTQVAHSVSSSLVASVSSSLSAMTPAMVVLSLTGPPGAGKSSLASLIAHHLQSHPRLSNSISGAALIQLNPTNPVDDAVAPPVAVSLPELMAAVTTRPPRPSCTRAPLPPMIMSDLLQGGPPMGPIKPYPSNTNHHLPLENTGSDIPTWLSASPQQLLPQDDIPHHFSPEDQIVDPGLNDLLNDFLPPQDRSETPSWALAILDGVSSVEQIEQLIRDHSADPLILIITSRDADVARAIPALARTPATALHFEVPPWTDEDLAPLFAANGLIQTPAALYSCGGLPGLIPSLPHDPNADPFLDFPAWLGTSGMTLPPDPAVLLYAIALVGPEAATLSALRAICFPVFAKRKGLEDRLSTACSWLKAAGLVVWDPTNGTHRIPMAALAAAVLGKLPVSPATLTRLHTNVTSWCIERLSAISAQWSGICQTALDDNARNLWRQGRLAQVRAVVDVLASVLRVGGSQALSSGQAELASLVKTLSAANLWLQEWNSELSQVTPLNSHPTAGSRSSRSHAALSSCARRRGAAIARTSTTRSSTAPPSKRPRSRL